MLGAYLGQIVTWWWWCESTITVAVVRSIGNVLYPGHDGGDTRVDSGELLVGAVIAVADDTNQSRPANNIKLMLGIENQPIKLRRDGPCIF